MVFTDMAHLVERELAFCAGDLTGGRAAPQVVVRHPRRLHRRLRLHHLPPDERAVLGARHHDRAVMYGEPV